MLFYVAGVSIIAALFLLAWRQLLPRPYPGIPHNKASAARIAGDIPVLIPVIKETNEFCNSLLTITTRKLGSPIAQFLFPGLRKPLIILDDPREIEDVLLRRNKEFDKAPISIDVIRPLFPKGSLTQYTTPELRAQKRLWADVMNVEFLRKTVAPNVHRSMLNLLKLWRLKASTIYKDTPFAVLHDFENAALDAIWVAGVGEEPGVTQYEITKLQYQIDGKGQDDIAQIPAPKGTFLREGIAYISDTVSRCSNSPVPKWASILETYRPRYRRFRSTMTGEVAKAMRKSVDRFQRLELGQLEDGENDTCMMDLVLRRKVAEARKSDGILMDPTQDQSMLDELLVLLIGGHDTTANALTWFVKLMETFPAAQTELRKVLQEAFPTSEPLMEEILGTNIPYLDAACEESFRLGGVAKTNLRSTLVDTHILGYPVPKGADIMLNFHLDRTPIPIAESVRSAASHAAAEKRGDWLHQKAGRDLGVFEPRRWLVKDEQTGAETFDAQALPMLAFGGGFRGCPGRKLATMEFRMAVVLLILNFKFLDLPEEYKTMSATEKMFRQPDKPYARLEIL